MLLEDFPERERWLQTLYAEIWKQYSHEDQLAQTRSHVFLVTQAALAAFLAGVSAPLFKLGCAKVDGANFHVGLFVLGVVWLVVGVFMWLLNDRFQKVTWAGRQYINFRHAHLRAIELATFGEHVGPALLEDHYRSLSKETVTKIRPFAGLAEKSGVQAVGAIEVFPFNGYGGFAFLFFTSNIWRIVFAVLAASGLALSFGSMHPDFLGTHLPTFVCK
jgi:hypothetical protein